MSVQNVVYASQQVKGELLCVVRHPLFDLYHPLSISLRVIIELNLLHACTLHTVGVLLVTSHQLGS